MVGVTEIAKTLGISKGAAHNLARTLEQEGFITQDPETKKYRLGVKSLELGAIASGTLEINQKAAGVANHLAERTQLLCRCGIWEKGNAVVTLSAAPYSWVPFAQRFGPRIPTYCTAIGKALLAFLPTEELDAHLASVQLVPYTPWTITDMESLKRDLEESASRGYSVSRQEIIAGRAGIGAPIFTKDRKLAGAIAISGELERVLGQETKKFVGSLVESASEISSYLGYRADSIGVPLLQGKKA
jgi:DNA-binding IclR family transcriptional regulator